MTQSRANAFLRSRSAHYVGRFPFIPIVKRSQPCHLTASQFHTAEINKHKNSRALKLIIPPAKKSNPPLSLPFFSFFIPHLSFITRIDGRIKAQLETREIQKSITRDCIHSYINNSVACCQLVPVCRIATFTRPSRNSVRKKPLRE